MLILFIFTALSIIFALIIVHEAAHYWVGKRLNVQIRRFAIGFGPTLYKWTSPKTGIEYVLGWIPIGGYVRMLDSREEQVSSNALPHAFDHQPLWARGAILLAGGWANFILALVLLSASLSIGLYQFKPIIGEIKPASIAALAGLKPGDVIIAVDGKPVIGWQATLLAMFKRVGDQDHMVLRIKRPQQPLQDFILNLARWQMQPHDPGPIQSLGIQPFLPKSPTSLADFPKNTLTWVQLPIWQAPGEAYKQLLDFAGFNYIMLGKVLNGKLALTALGGPLSLLQGVYFAMGQGFAMVLSFAALLSVSLGIINLLPIPGLDGGQLFFLLVEAILRRPVRLATQVLAYRLGFILLVLLMFQVVINDFVRWFGYM